MAKTAVQKDAKKYERLVRGLSSAGNSLAMYPPGHPIVEKQLQGLHQLLIEILKTDNSLSIHKGEGVLVVNDRQIPTTGKSIEKIINHFDDFKITDLEFVNNPSYEELKNFLDIFTHSEESINRYGDLNTACSKNQITNIRSMQAAYIRVPKDIKDKLGGKTVGELKISKEEMDRLLSYLKGEINLTRPDELKIYHKVFENPSLLTSLIDKIVIDSEKLPADQRKKLVIIALNRTGHYLNQTLIGSRKQKKALDILSNLNKSLISDSKTFVALGSDPQFKNEINQTIEQLKSLVKNQTVITEYNRYKEKLDRLKEKVQAIAPQLVTPDSPATQTLPPDLKKLLVEIRSFFEKISKDKNITTTDIKKIADLNSKIQNFLK